jgi:hypothetical protein
MKWQEFCVVPEMGVTDWPSGAHAPLAAFAIQADAPLARVVGFAPVSLTEGDVVTMTNCRFFAWPKMTTRALLFRCAGVEALQIRAGLCVLRVDR